MGTSTRGTRGAVPGLLMAAMLSGCASVPLGPSVPVMPASNKPFEVFQQDDAMCRQYASQQIAGGVNQVNGQAVGTTVLTTILGAGLGAAVGGGSGAAIGAASGAVVGTAMGANDSAYGGYGLQRGYDTAYSQCMYAKGNQVPGYSYGSYTPPPPPPGG